MGSVGDFIFGGSQGSQQGQQSRQSAYGSQNSSQNQSVQGSSTVSSNQTSSGSQSANKAYAPIASAMSPALGYVTNAGNMMAALLGLPTTPASHASTPASSGSSTPMGTPLLPPVASYPVPTSNLASVMASVKANTPTPSVPTPTTATNSLLQTLAGATQSTPNIPSNVNGSGYNGYVPPNTNVQYRAAGGPVEAGQPYVVGENQPELFVPHQSGTILPQIPQEMMNNYQMFRGGNRFHGPIPGTPAPPGVPSPTPSPVTPTPTPGTPAANPATNALNTFANSAGEQFILDQGQQALSGASAANGVFDSGATGKALVQYGQGLGSQYLNQYMQNLGQYAGLGLGAAGAMAGAGGVSQSQSQGSGTSIGSSFGSSVGSSQGTSAGGSTSSGTSSGSDSSKKGLL